MAGNKQYGWKDLSVSIGSKILDGATGLKYSRKKEKEFLYGRGDSPHEILSGNNSNEGTIKIWQSDFEAMVAEAIDGDVLQLRFNITEAYVPADGGDTVINILKDCEFTEEASDINQGDKNQIIELPFMFLKLARQQ